MEAPASAERLIFRRREETDHDHSMNAIGGEGGLRNLTERQLL
jgi:hypothetical protein